jgi:hypothetical protein
MNQSLFYNFLVPQYNFFAALFGPSYFNVLALLIMTLVLVNPYPLTASEKDDSTREALLIWLRRILVLCVPLLAVFLPIYIYLVIDAIRVADLGAQSGKLALSWLLRVTLENVWRVGAGFAVALVVKSIYQRFIAPVVSHWFHQRRVTLGMDAKSDIRTTAGALVAKDFSPVQYYKDGHMFFGLDQDNAPIYVDLDTFRKTNLQVIGPTRFGKGVLLGVLMDQAIRAGHAVIYVDPKSDEWLPWVMHHTAGADRRFVVIDLNATGKQRWHPFAGGTLRERRARVVVACGLADTGTDGDFYKRAERGILDEMLPKCGSGSIASMLAALEAKGSDNKPLKESAPRLFESLREWSLIPALNPEKKGMSVEEVIKNGWVFYFRGAMDDRTVLAATRVFIMEVIQQAKRLKEERGNRQLTLAVDELKFLISQELSDALATSLGHNVNIVVCHQSIGDLRGPEDKTLDAKALEQGVLTNCQLKVLYRCDPETAEWGAKLSGTRQIKVMRAEKVHTNAAGGQVYNDDHMIANEEEALIHENVLLSLPPRVGVLFSPHALARTVYTSPVQVSKGTDLFAEHPDFSSRRKREKEKEESVVNP